MVTLESVFDARQLIAKGKLDKAMDCLYTALSSNIQYDEVSDYLNSLLLLRSQYHIITKNFLEQLVDIEYYHRTLTRITRSLLYLCESIIEIETFTPCDDEKTLVLNLHKNSIDNPFKKIKDPVSVELVITKPLCDYTVAEKNKLFEKISLILQMNGGQIVIKEIREGSVIITFNLSRTQAQILHNAFLKRVFFENKVEKLTILTEIEDSKELDSTKSNNALASDTRVNNLSKSVIDSEVMQLMEKGLFKEAIELYKKV